MASEKQRAKRREISRRFLRRHPGYKRDWYRANRERLLEYERNRRRTNSEEWRKARKAQSKAWAHGIRSVVLARFGNRCVRCGFSDPRALQIDHINGNGRKDVKRYGSQTTFIRALANMPDRELYSRYQLLCANCNWIKRFENEEWSNGS